MNINNIKKDVGKREVSLCIKIEPALYNWIKIKGYSQTKIFREACMELGYGK